MAGFFSMGGFDSLSPEEKFRMLSGGGINPGAQPPQMGPPRPPQQMGPPLPGAQQGIMAGANPGQTAGPMGAMDDVALAQEAYRADAERAKEGGTPKRSTFQKIASAIAPVGLAVATGGLSMVPAAIGFALANESEEQKNEAQREFEWRQAQMGEAGDSYVKAHEAGLPPTQGGYNRQLKQVYNPEKKQMEFAEYDPRTGAWRNTGMIAEGPEAGKTHTPGELGKASFDMFNKPYHMLDGQQKQAIDEFLQTSKVRTAIEINSDPRVRAGVRQEAEQKTGGKESVENQWANVQHVQLADDALIEYDDRIGELENYLQLMEAGEIDATGILAGLQSYWDTEAARLMRLNNAETLGALGEQTLTPVSDKDIQVLRDSIFKPGATQAARIAAFKDYISGKKRERDRISKKRNTRSRYLPSDYRGAFEQPAGQAEEGEWVTSPSGVKYRKK